MFTKTSKAHTILYASVINVNNSLSPRLLLCMNAWASNVNMCMALITCEIQVPDWHNAEYMSITMLITLIPGSPRLGQQGQCHNQWGQHTL